jgi:folate-binding protein YgfZ
MRLVLAQHLQAASSIGRLENFGAFKGNNRLVYFDLNDFDESVLPAETGLFERAVSLTKGCYLGQEIVARMHARGQVARRLVGIRMESDALPLAGTKIYDDQQNEIGGITSSTISPVLSNIAIGLGYVKKPFFSTGTKLHIPAEGAMHSGEVIQLPFIGHG